MALLKELSVNPRTGKPKYYQEGNTSDIQKDRNNKSNPRNNPQRMFENGKYFVITG